MAVTTSRQVGITSVSLAGFRGIAHGELREISPLTVLVGPNGCGKSSVLEAIYVASSLQPGQAMNQCVERRGHSDHRWLVFQGEAKASLVVRTDVGTTWRVVLASHPVVPSAVNVTREEAATKADSDNSAAPPWPVVMVDTRAGGDIPQRHLQDMYSMATKLGRREFTQEVIRAILPDANGIEILTERGQPFIFVVFENGSVPLALVGDGIQRVFRIALELASMKEGTALLEEPEVYQHPRAIRQTAKAILVSVRRGLQVIISTHSLELIDALLEESTPEDLSQTSIFRLVLQRGELKTSRLNGDDARFARKQIEDDLR